MRSTCPDDNEAAAYVEGRATPDDAAAIEAHVARCARCGELLASLRTLFATRSVPRAPEREALDVVSDEHRYEPLGPVGVGGGGVVLAAYDHRLGRRVAIKVVRPDRLSAPSARGSLVREARAAARVVHPNVVTVHDAVERDGQVWIVMELLEGASLRRWVESAPRAHERVAAMFVDAARGLAAVHRAGLAHRDIKPDNLLVGPDDTLKVADLGLATDMGTGDGAWVGTPGYVAPEVLAGGAGDARSDQYSLAVTLHEALTGARPRTPSDVAPLPRAVRDTLQRALHPDPARRFPDLDAFADSLADRDPRGRAILAIHAAFLAALAFFELILWVLICIGLLTGPDPQNDLTLPPGDPAIDVGIVLVVGIATLLSTLSAIGLALRARWGWVLAIVHAALVALTCIGVPYTALAIATLSLPSTRAALRVTVRRASSQLRRPALHPNAY